MGCRSSRCRGPSSASNGRHRKVRNGPALNATLPLTVRSRSYSSPMAGPTGTSSERDCPMFFSCELMTFYKGSGFHPHLPGFKHKFLAKALGATMWFFIFYRARFVLLLFDDNIRFMSFFREDGPKLLVRCRLVEITKLTAYYTGFEAPMGGTCTWASWRRNITSLVSAATPSLHHGIANVDFCSVW
jgi:hypothetical protein